MDSVVGRYRRDGYVTFEERFPTERLARLREAAQRLVGCIPEWGRGCPRLVWRHDCVSFIAFPADLEPAFAELLTDDWLLERLRLLMGPDIEYYEGSVVVKGPGEPTVFPWHQDLPHIPHSNTNLCATFIHLDDFTDGEGALTIIPGTHRGGLEPHRRGMLETTAEQRARAVTQRVPAGALTIMHSLVWHEGMMSHAPSLRLRALCFFRGADCAPIGRTGEKPPGSAGTTECWSADRGARPGPSRWCIRRTSTTERDDAAIFGGLWRLLARSSWAVVISLRTVKAPSPREFAALVADGRPAIVTGAFDSWAAMARWCERDYLRARIGSEPVPVEVYPGGDTGAPASYVYRQMTVDQFLDGMAPTPGRPALFLIVPLPSALVEDAPTPAILADVSRTIWLYGDRTYSNLHFHPFQHSLACQVVGRKRFGLYAPDQTHYIYPQPLRSKWFEYTRVERFPTADLARWPRVTRARGVEVTLEPGQALFIPRHWWHWASTEEVSSHVLHYFGPHQPVRWLWTSPGRRSLFWLVRLKATGALARARRRVETRLGVVRRPPVGDQPAR